MLVALDTVSIEPCEIIPCFTEDVRNLSYRRILVMEGFRRQRLEPAI
jgi:hypothetical protein